MSLRTLVEDARFLRGADRNLGALALLLAAVGASSRVKYPKSAHTGPDPLSKDPVAYKSFLGGRIGQMMGVDDPRDTLTASGFQVDYLRGETRTRQLLEQIIYKEYRCALLHEGQLSGKAKFVSQILPNVTQYGIDNGCWFSIGWEADGTFLFDSGLLDVLDRAVSGARINGEAFGVVHPPQFIYEHLGVANDDEVRLRIEGAFGLPNGGWMSIRSAVEILARHRADWGGKESIAALLLDLATRQIIIGGTMTGLKFAGIVGDDRTLSARGFEMLKLAASCYRLAQVA